MKRATNKTAINNLRVLSCEMIENAKSGHPGMCLSAAPIMYSLFANVLRYDGNNPNSIFRDRFVMSAGHGSALYYATLHMFGYDITTEDLSNFRRLGSKTPGHPEYDKTPGVDCSTGALGQGIANAVGLAIEAKRFASKFGNKLFSNHVFCLCGDGCLMEGISYEALALAGSLKLDNLIVIYDQNKKTIDGSLENCSCEDVVDRLQANNWRVYKANGNSVRSITKALKCARKHKHKPTFIIVNTKIGYGTDLEDNEKCHGAPIGREQIDKLKAKFGITTQGLEVMPEVQELCNKKAEIRKKELNLKESLFTHYKNSKPKLYNSIMSQMNYDYNFEALKILNTLQVDETKAGRDINHDILNAVAKVVPSMVGGSADLENSTKVFIENGKHVAKGNYGARNIHYGIREHAMAGINNGIALYNGALPFCSTFLVFSDYMKPAIRMSALMNLPTLYIFTHDSITIGQDGPTHQPIEHLASLRAIPNLQVFRCYNAEEMIEAYKYYFTTRKPTVIVVSKQKMQLINAENTDISRGGYILRDNKNYDYTLVATGEDVNLALEIDNMLGNKCKARVVSMPNMRLFNVQPDNYKNQIINKDKKVVLLELATSFGWSDVVGTDALKLTMDTFGASGSREEVLNYFDFGTEKLANRIMMFVKDEVFRLPKIEVEPAVEELTETKEQVEEEPEINPEKLDESENDRTEEDSNDVEEIETETTESEDVEENVESQEPAKKSTAKKSTTKKKTTTKKSTTKKKPATKKKKTVSISEIPFE